MGVKAWFGVGRRLSPCPWQTKQTLPMANKTKLACHFPCVTV
ncbi:MAG: hypothetical protein RR975_06875 [Clostridia bacterium]